MCLSMASAIVDIDSDEDGEPDDFLKFFSDVEEELYSIKMVEVPHKVIKIIVSIINSTKDFTFEWRDYVEGMGLNDSVTFAVIEGSAESHNQLPLYFALTKPLRNQKFGKFIDVLKKKQRVDVLRLIKPIVKEYLEKRKQILNGENITWNSNLDDIINTYFIPKIKDCSIELSKDTENLQKNCVNSISVDVPKYIVKLRKFLSVFIPHVVEDTEVSKKLASKLRHEYDIDVTQMSDLECFFSVDDCGVIEGIMRKADFKVPVVSLSYLRCIRANSEYDMQSEDICNNRLVFRYMQSEFKRNNSLNFKVKPIMVEDVDINLVRKELLFNNPLRLWNDVEKLVDNMTQTKKSLPHLFKM